MLVCIKEEYPKTPLAISISGQVIKKLTLLNELELELDPLITLNPEELDLKQVNYLKEQYGAGKTTGCLLSGQVRE
ncbi:unnamed protein product, partial [marine sediment metagenome]